MIYYFEIFESRLREWDRIYYPLGMTHGGWYISRELTENRETYINGRLFKTWDIM